MNLPGYSGTSYFAGERAGVRLGWDFFLGIEGRAVARNIFLDGNTSQNSIRARIDACSFPPKIAEELADQSPRIQAVSLASLLTRFLL